ncbi:hypothetical protein BGZ65_010527, partial [Modicella reniformis]
YSRAAFVQDFDDSVDITVRAGCQTSCQSIRGNGVVTRVWLVLCWSHGTRGRTFVSLP